MLPVAGALLLGDAFNMRHPLTGGGMTVALSDCKLLCDLLQPLPSFSDPVSTASRTADFYVQRKPMCATINTLANALYKVFCFTGRTTFQRAIICMMRLYPAASAFHADVKLLL